MYDVVHSEIVLVIKLIIVLFIVLFIVLITCSVLSRVSLKSTANRFFLSKYKTQALQSILLVFKTGLCHVYMLYLSFVTYTKHSTEVLQFNKYMLQQWLNIRKHLNVDI